MRRRKNVAISVNGPSGPRLEVKPSTAFLAGLLKVAMSRVRYRVIHERERTVSTAVGKIQNRVKKEK